MRHNENGLYGAIEKVLRATDGPLDCHALYDMPTIREHAASANRVSDYLGGLWRKGLVLRLPTSSTDEASRSRWAYEWKKDTRRTANPDDVLFESAKEVGVEYNHRIIADRPSVLITEKGSTITIELPNLILMIKTKP
jgi:hypothetical protein